MTLEQLRIFVAVADALSMTRAAERLNLTQPAVSAAIAALEGRHKARLFDRVGRRLELSEAGRLFLPEARAVLDRAEIAGRVFDDLAGLARGHVRIAASQTVATYWLPGRMARFAAQYPGIELSLALGNTAQTAASVLDGTADIGFVEGVVDEDLLSTRIVGHDRLGLYAAANHPLASKFPATIDLESATWVLREPGSGTRDHAIASLTQSGITTDALNIRLELPSNGAVLAAVQAGGLLTVVSDLAAAPHVRAGAIHRLDWPLPNRDFTMLAHRARRPSRAVDAFVRSLENEAAPLSQSVPA